MKQGKEGYDANVDLDWLPEQDSEDIDPEYLRHGDIQASQPQTGDRDESLGLNLCETRSLQTPEQRSRANADFTALHQQNAPRGPGYDHQQIN